MQTSANLTITRIKWANNRVSINRNINLLMMILEVSSLRATITRLIIRYTFLRMDFWADPTNSIKIEYDLSLANQIIKIANIVEYINAAVYRYK